jgi:hypothetical protein
MPISYSNVVTGNGRNSALETKMPMLGLSPQALANARAKGIGSNLWIDQAGQVRQKPKTAAPAPTAAGLVTQPKAVPTPGAMPGVDTQFAPAPRVPSAPVQQPQQKIPQDGREMRQLAQKQYAERREESEKAPTYSGLIGDLTKVGKEGSQSVDQATQALLDFRKKSAQYIADIYDAPTSARIMQGREAAVQLANAKTEEALSQNVANALAQQGQQITALGSAAGYAQPIQVSPGNIAASPITGNPLLAGPMQVSPGNVAVDPLTGRQVASTPQLSQPGQTYYDPRNPGASGNTGNIVNDWATWLAQGGDPRQVPSTVSGNSVLWAQVLQGARSMNPGFDVNSALGAAGARETVAGLQGGLPVTGAAGVYENALPAYYQMQAQLNNVDQLGNLLLSTTQGGQINPFAPQFANRTLADIRRQLSSEEQARFDSTLATFQGAAQQLLASSSGGLPTDVTNKINAIASGNISMAALGALVDQARQEGGIKLSNQAGIVNQALSTVQGGATGSGLYSW